ncbi:AAA family ATPase [Sessilibacter sp. MAH4]
MKLHIERDIATRILEDFNILLSSNSKNSWQEQLKLAGRIEVKFSDLTNELLALLVELYANKNATKFAVMTSLLNSRGQPSFESSDLEEFLAKLIQYLCDDAIRGWLFLLDGGGSLLPYVISRIDYTPGGQDDQPRILIEIKANTRGKLANNQIIISARDLSNLSAAEILAEKGYLKESPELIAEFDQSNIKYQQWRSDFGEQFSALGTGIYAEDPSANQRKTDWSQKTRVILSTSGSPARVVNDEAILTQRELTLNQANTVLKPLTKKIDRNSPFSPSTEKIIEHLQTTFSENSFTEIPMHGFILMFHLELHHHLWVHVDNIEPYRYQPELKDKLVLPTEHVELIDILTAEMEILMEDIVEGKSGGTTVLCSGPPGVGKTLTAEVYAEIIRRPLYRVHSGQLGLNVAEMEANLKDVLIRAQRWGAVMLIDESDVYIKRRDDNLTMNAVVGVFLRVLEYFNGLLFMTTNRIDDIDEAIISRCIAMIRYQQPNEQERAKIWQVMSQQFGLNLTEDMCETLSNHFPKTSGRDIKGLAKLVARFCTYRNIGADINIFEHCAKFRAIDIANPND